MLIGTIGLEAISQMLLVGRVTPCAPLLGSNFGIINNFSSETARTE